MRETNISCGTVPSSRPILEKSSSTLAVAGVGTGVAPRKVNASPSRPDTSHWRRAGGSDNASS
eukprot:363409-Rhodomonas_salina.1